MRTMLATCVLGLWLLGAAPAAAQLDPCLADPVACAGETVTGVTEAVEDTAGAVEDTLEDTVDDVTGPVDEVIDPDPGGGDPVPAGDGGGGGAAGDPGGSTPSTRGEGGPGPASSEAPIAPTARPGPGARLVEDTGRSVIPVQPATGVLDRVQQALAESTEAFAFPLALITVVAAFLLLQGRFDRSDPKLALAPVETSDEPLTFA